MPEDLAGLRQRLAGILPGRIHAAVAAYEDFTALVPPIEAKAFTAWHAAAKAALAHVDLLVKLAHWAEAKTAEAESEAEARAEDTVEHLLSQARAALDALDRHGETAE